MPGPIPLHRGVFVCAKGPHGELARQALESTPDDRMRTVYDLDECDLLGVAHPPLSSIREHDGICEHLAIDLIRSWLSPASVTTLARSLAACRRLRENEELSYKLTYRPPLFEPYTLRFTARPLLLDAKGRAYVIVNNVEVMPAENSIAS